MAKAKQTTEQNRAETADNRPKPTRLRKITTTELWGKGRIKAKAKQPGQGEFLVMRIWGRMDGANEMETNFGPCQRLLGTFKAISGNDGLEYISSTLFLPGFIERDLMSIYNVNGSGVEFAFDITARPTLDDDETDQPFEYVCTPLFEPSDSLLAIDARLPHIDAELLSLPAPEKKDAVAA